MKKYASTYISALFLFLSAGVGQAWGQRAFRPGEELEYTASYNASVLSTDIATAVLRTSVDHLEGIPCYKFTGKGQTKSIFSVFFKVEDVYTSWMSQDSLKPLLATTEIREGNYRYESRTAFNWKSDMIYTYGKNLKSGRERGGTRPAQVNELDPLNYFYHLRNTDLEKMKQGEVRTINLAMIKETVRIQYRFLGREIIDAPSTGEVRCLKFACQLATGDSDAFPEDSEFHIWISDDKNKIPVYVETPVRVGSVYATLTKWKNLAHPFDAQLKKKKK